MKIIKKIHDPTKITAIKYVPNAIDDFGKIISKECFCAKFKDDDTDYELPDNYPKNEFHEYFLWYVMQHSMIGEKKPYVSTTPTCFKNRTPTKLILENEKQMQKIMYVTKDLDGKKLSEGYWFGLTDANVTDDPVELELE